MFFSSLCTPELRTSGGMLTLFIFIDPLSVCGERKKKHYHHNHYHPANTHTRTHTATTMHEFSSGAEQVEAAPDLSPVHLSLSFPGSPLMCSRKCHQTSRKEFFLFFFFMRPPPSLLRPKHTHKHIYPPISHMSKTICCRSLILTTILNPHPTPTPLLS